MSKLSKKKMVSDELKEIRIFYSWQSWRKSVKNFIDKALYESVAELQKFFSSRKLIFDSDMKKRTGAEDIHEAVFEQIQNCDIYIADITIISEITQEKKVSNPNVLIELGFAIKCVGWDRIILLFDERYGKLSTDLPFDICVHRVFPFSKRNRNKIDGSTRLQKMLVEQIKLIIEKSPEKSYKKYEITSSKGNRQNDIKTISYYLSSINIQLIDCFIKDMPYKFDKKILYCFEELNSKMNCDYYYVYDEKIRVLFGNFLKAWDKCLSFGKNYEYKPKNNYFFFIDNPCNPSQDTDEKKLNKFLKIFNLDFKNLLNEIRDNWPEININEISDNM